MKTEKLIELIQGVFQNQAVDYTIMNHEFDDSFNNHLIIIRHNNRSFTFKIEDVFSIKIDYNGHGYVSYNDIINTAVFIFAEVGFAKTVADVIWTVNIGYDERFKYRDKNNILTDCFAVSIIQNHIDAAKCIMFTDWGELSDQKLSTLTGLRSEWFGVHHRFNNWFINMKLNDYIDMYLQDIPVPISVECKALMLEWKQKHPEYESEDMEL